jgi:hypothetical protein
MQSSQSEFYVDPAAIDRHLASVSKDMQLWANRVVTGFTDIAKAKMLKAEQVLTKAMSALTDADRYQFLLTNLIEGLKRGDTPSKMIERYNEIGLTEIQIEPPNPSGVMPNPPAIDPQHPPMKPVGMIRRMLNGLASICAPLIKIAITVAKAISEHVKFKFKPIMGTTGFLPSLSFLLEPEIEGEIKLGECFEGLGALLDRFAHAAF